jgi:hypothetical protein
MISLNQKDIDKANNPRATYTKKYELLNICIAKAVLKAKAPKDILV